MAFPGYDDYNDLPNNDLFVNNNNYDNERKLYDLLLTETYNKHGIPLDFYISTYDTNYDKIFGEDNNRRYTRKFSIMAYYELPKEMELWTKFGIEGIDNFQMFVSKRHFKAASTNGGYDEWIPRAGDVIYATYNKLFYEIIDVGEEEEIYRQRKHVWVFTVQKFKDEHVSIDNSLSADMADLFQYTNQKTDVLNVSATVDQKKTAILYTPSPTEKAPDVEFGNW